MQIYSDTMSKSIKFPFYFIFLLLNLIAVSPSSYSQNGNGNGGANLKISDPTISNVTATSKSVCPTSTINISFTLQNGKGSVNSGAYFTTSTLFTISLITLDILGNLVVIDSGNSFSLTAAELPAATNEATSSPITRKYTIPLNTATSTNYRIEISSTNPEIVGSDLSRSEPFTISDNNYWSGAIDSDWNKAGNWECDLIPSFINDAVINNVTTTYPILNTGAAGKTRNLTVSSGSSLSIVDNTLKISGAIINNGNFNVENGGVSLEGTTTQTIPAGVFENNRILNLNINNPSGVTNHAEIHVLNSLKVENGNFQTNDLLLLVSDASKTAFIDGSGAGEVLGRVKMQRYLPNPFGYKYFSSPFSNSVVGDLAAFFPLTDPVTAFPHFYEYLQDRKDSVGNDLTGWKKYLDPTAPLEPAKGYAINTSGETAPLTFELSGNVSNGDITVNLENNNGTYTNGFNLVGNPYPSPVDWSLMVPSLSGIDNAIYFFTAGTGDRYTGTYTSFVNGISTDGRSSSIIPSMQGFFVRVSDPANSIYPTTANLTFTNASRTGNQVAHQYYEAQNKIEVPKIRITAGFEEEEISDAVVIYFKNGATPQFEKELDAQKILNTAVDVPNFYSLTRSHQKIAINAISQLSSEILEIPLGVTAERAGEMQLSMAATTNISPNTYIYLRDNKKKILKDFNESESYSFSFQKGEINDRFALILTSQKLTPAQLALATEDFSVYTREEEIVVRLNLMNNAEGKISISNLSGQILQTGTGHGTEEVKFSGNFVEGIYLVTLETESESYTKKILFKN